MAKRKLTAFSADEADDAFTPSVTTIKGGEIETPETPAKPKGPADSKPGQGFQAQGDQGQIQDA